MNVLLTGATGFIGSYVLRLLLEKKIQVSLIVRNAAKLNRVRTKHLQVFRGSITDKSTVDTAVRGCDSIVHLAALVRSSSDYPSEFFDVNVTGTVNLLESAAQHRVKKFIFTSSLAAHEIKKRELIDEECILKAKNYFSDYAESKAIAEEEVIKHGEKGMAYIILYPQRLFGIGPLNDANGATKAISLYLRNRLPFLIEGGKQYSSWSFVEDVAGGIVSSLETNTANDEFILGGENKTLLDVFKLADQITGKKHLRLNVSKRLALSIAGLIEFQSKIFKNKPLINRKWLNYVVESYQHSSQKAIEKIGYKITPFERALSNTVNWLVNK